MHCSGECGVAGGGKGGGMGKDLLADFRIADLGERREGGFRLWLLIVDVFSDVSEGWWERCWFAVEFGFGEPGKGTSVV